MCVLIVPVPHSFCHFFNQLRAHGEIGKALTQINRIIGFSQLTHYRKNGSSYQR